MLVAFDVDGTLIDHEDKPRWEIIDLLRMFHRLGCRIVVWSGGGADYADMWVRRLHLEPFVSSAVVKDPYLRPDLAVDDVAGADGLADLVLYVGPDEGGS